MEGKNNDKSMTVPPFIYILSHKVESMDSRKSSRADVAYMNGHAAFETLMKILTREYHWEDNLEISWDIDFSNCRDDKIRFIGKGPVYIGDDDDEKEPATITIGIERYWVGGRNK